MLKSIAIAWSALALLLANGFLLNLMPHPYGFLVGVFEFVAFAVVVFHIVFRIVDRKGRSNG